jgi:protease I
MSNSLQGFRVAILAADAFEYVELAEPKKAFEAAGAKTEIVSLKSGKIQGWNHDKPGGESNAFSVEKTVDQAKAADYDALLLPGGVKNPDTMRVNEAAVQFVKAFFDDKKPVAAICHGPWMLVEAGVVKGRQLTSWPSLKTDIQNAGGCWSDEEVIVDGNLVTSRKPDDLPAFNKKAIEQFAVSKQYQNA